MKPDEIDFAPWTAEDRANWLDWFQSNAKDDVRYVPTTLEMLAKMDDDVAVGNQPTYELPAHYTVSGRPELFSF